MIALRPASRDQTDAKALADTLEEASEGLFSVLLGREARRILADVAMVGGHDLSLDHATVAEVDGEIAGVLQGTHAREIGRGERELMRAAGWRGLRAGVIGLLGRRVFNAMSTHGPDDWYLQAVAVLPAWRGKGIGTRLIEAAFEQARDSGALAAAQTTKSLPCQIGSVTSGQRILWRTNSIP